MVETPRVPKNRKNEATNAGPSPPAVEGLGRGGPTPGGGAGVWEKVGSGGSKSLPEAGGGRRLSNSSRGGVGGHGLQNGEGAPAAPATFRFVNYAPGAVGAKAGGPSVQSALT